MRAKITLAKTAGFCFGVQRAIDMVQQALDTGDRVCTLGPLIHNTQFVQALERQGVAMIDSVAENTEGRRVIIRSHGVAPEVYEQLQRAGMPYTDATCPFVAKIHKIVSLVEPNAALVIVGDRNHPEVQGIMGHCSGSGLVGSSCEELLND